MKQDEFREMRESLKRIEIGLFGDEKMGQFGLVSRVNNHAGRIKRIERWVLSIGGGAVTVGIIYKVYVDLWPHK